MKNIIIKGTIFEEGDYVMTPEGYGVVVEDELEYFSLDNLRYKGEVKVQHKSGLSANTENAVREMDRFLLLSVTAKEYNEGE